MPAENVICPALPADLRWAHCLVKVGCTHFADAPRRYLALGLSSCVEIAVPSAKQLGWVNMIHTPRKKQKLKDCLPTRPTRRGDATKREQSTRRKCRPEGERDASKLWGGGQ